MAFYERAAEFLTARVTPRLAIGHGPRNQPTRAELEVLAEQEIQARIDRGRPGPDEAYRRDGAALPDWAMPQPRPTRALDVVSVNLAALGGPVPPAAQPARKTRVTGQAPSA